MHCQYIYKTPIIVAPDDDDPATWYYTDKCLARAKDGTKFCRGHQ